MSRQASHPHRVAVIASRIEVQLATLALAEGGGSPQMALLTIYDMCKAVDRGMRITDVHVLEKLGGNRGVGWRGETCNANSASASNSPPYPEYRPPYS